MIAAVIAIITGWLLNCVIKGIITGMQERRLCLRSFFHDGGMPSAHSAFVASVATAVFIETGFSILFIVTTGFSLIVLHDAMNVRYQAGEQAKIIKKIIGEKRFKQAGLKTLLGHKPSETAAGVLTGIIGASIGYAIFL